jgi:hypothetical protein
MGLSFKLFLATTIVCISFCASQCFSQAFITTQRIAPIGVINFESNQQMLPPEGFVNGYVRKGGSGNFIFPVGDDDIYGPFSANGDNVSGLIIIRTRQSRMKPRVLQEVRFPL